MKTTKTEMLNKLNRKVEKLNKFIQSCIDDCGGEHDLYLDTSSTVEGLPEHIEPNFSISKDMKLMEGEDVICEAACYDKAEGWYESWELDDYIKWTKSCVRKGVRYFKEYNPELDDDDEAREKFMEEL